MVASNVKNGFQCDLMLSTGMHEVVVVESLVWSAVVWVSTPFSFFFPGTIVDGRLRGTSAG